MTSVSSAKSPTLSAPSSIPSSRRGSETQRITTAFAIGRPEPYGKIPLRRPSGSKSSMLSQSSASPPDVSLSGIEGFDYDESWSLGVRPFLKPVKGASQSSECDQIDVTSSSPLTEVDDEEHQDQTGKSISRASTISSRRSSKESGRRPSLLQQSFSPPLANSQSVSAIGQASSSPRTSKSLAEKSGLSVIPSLYRVSRGRSANVKLGGTWIERRGTSASVLLLDDHLDQRAKVVDGKRREVGQHIEQGSNDTRERRRRRRRRKSSEGTESALFSSEDDSSLSSEEEEQADVASCATSRRSSTDRERRRRLKILLTPSVIRQGTDDEVGPECAFLTSLSEKDILANNKPSSPLDVLSFSDDEVDSDVNRSALLDRRRSSSGKRLLGSSLRSNSSSHRASSKLEVIFAGLTPDGLCDPNSIIVPMNNKQPVDIDADPLLSSAIGSVSDLIDVDAVVWNDQNRRSSNFTGRASTLKENRRQTVEDQEKERRVGFAADYQNRLASLLWSTKSTFSGNATKTEVHTIHSNNTSANHTGTAISGDGDSLLTTSWKRLIQLPNLLLMPTLGPSRTSALQSEEVKNESKRSENISGTDEASAAQLLSMPPSPGPIVMLPPSPVLSPNNPKDIKGRGVMNPLEGDSDVSAYVSGLGLPIDPDLELSSVVHLQTFRTTQAPFTATPSRSRRGSLEKPASGDTQIHRRAFSDNKMEIPLPSLKLGKKLSDELHKRRHEVAEAKEEIEIKKKQMRTSSRSCSRPAVQAPVPGNFSAYNSSESEGEESCQKSSSDESRSRQSNNRRGRTSGGRRRSCSPSISNRKQCAIGLFESRTHSRSRTSEMEVAAAAADRVTAHMIRIRSTPNLPSLVATKEKRQDRLRRSNDAGGRGRAGSIKVVSASIAGEEEAIQEDVKAITALPNLLPISPIPSYPSSTSSPRSPLALGLSSSHGDMATVRPSMVSNGAHLLMLSLELEMMRHRKITCSLKPRWLKARVRSDSGLHRIGIDAISKEGSNSPMSSLAHAKPKQGSSLRFEVI